MPVARPGPYELRRRDADVVEVAPAAEALDGKELTTAWWEWPLVVLFIPLRWAGRGVATVAKVAADFVDAAARAAGRVCDFLVLRPLRALSAMLMRPLSWLGRAARSLLQTPAALMRAAGRQLDRGLTLLFQTCAAVLAWVFRPVALLVARMLSAPARFVARMLTRSWRAAGRLGSLLWRTATRPVRRLARAVRDLMAMPFRRLDQRVAHLKAGIGARASRLRRKQRDLSR